jgi:hypothetical protein
MYKVKQEICRVKQEKNKFKLQQGSEQNIYFQTLWDLTSNHDSVSKDI